jgi:hypothetical protein
MGPGAITVMTATALWAYLVQGRSLDLILEVRFSTSVISFYCTDDYMQRTTL